MKLFLILYLCIGLVLCAPRQVPRATEETPSDATDEIQVEPTSDGLVSFYNFFTHLRSSFII